MDREDAAFERDRALVRAMRILGEPYEVIEELLACLDLDEGRRVELLGIARADATLSAD